MSAFTLFSVAPQRATVAVIQQFGGAIRRVGDEATAYPGRSAAYEVLTLAGWTNAADNEKNLADIRGFWQRVARFTNGFYINTSAPDDQDRLRANFGRNYDRLVRVKTQYDPQNLFRLNANIRPREA